MKYQTITYQAVRNLGNYESERLEMTVELEGDDAISPDGAALLLRHRVNSILDSPPAGVTGKPSEDPIEGF